MVGRHRPPLARQLLLAVLARRPVWRARPGRPLVRPPLRTIGPLPVTAWGLAIFRQRHTVLLALNVEKFVIRPGQAEEKRVSVNVAVRLRLLIVHPRAGLTRRVSAAEVPHIRK